MKQLCLRFNVPSIKHIVLHPLSILAIGTIVRLPCLIGKFKIEKVST